MSVKTAKKPKAPARQEVKAKPKAVRLYREFEGVVEAAKANKTIRVSVARILTNEKYKKQYTRSTVFAVHDEKGEAKLGDKVLIRECRPISKTKRYLLISVVKRAV